LDINLGGWRDDDRWVVIRLPVWSPVGPEGDDEAGADEDTRPSRPMPPSVPMPPVAMSLVPVPATVSVPWQGADHEQHGDQGEYACPRRLCPHGHHLSLQIQTPILPAIVATIFQASPGQILDVRMQHAGA